MKRIALFCLVLLVVASVANAADISGQTFSNPSFTVTFNEDGTASQMSNVAFPFPGTIALAIGPFGIGVTGETYTWSFSDPVVTVYNHTGAIATRFVVVGNTIFVYYPLFKLTAE